MTTESNVSNGLTSTARQCAFERWCALHNYLPMLIDPGTRGSGRKTTLSVHELTFGGLDRVYSGRFVSTINYRASGCTSVILKITKDKTLL